MLQLLRCPKIRSGQESIGKKLMFKCLETRSTIRDSESYIDNSEGLDRVYEGCSESISILNLFYLFQKTPSGGTERIMRAHISPCLTKIGRSVQRAVQSH
ncbi:hypothetical protein TNCV_3909191 [Trichonephila clavipes]|nr:hypothetical protein TNCV_3909191 [Trichonephila clavipes]